MNNQIEPIHIISLGAGVQSSTMALMAAKGEITPMPKCAIFADTQDEPKEVYDTLDTLEGLLPFPIVRVTNGKLSATFKEKFVHIPTFKLKKDGSVSMGKRQCTKNFKLKPIYHYAKQMCFATSKQPVILWVGITTDEISRVKPARVKYIKNRWPFIENGKNRYWCEQYLKLAGLKVAKSACEFCPLHSDYSWRHLSKVSFQRAAQLDRWFNKERKEYLHPSCKPLAEIDFSTEEERGQLNMFNNECEGLCGV